MLEKSCLTVESAAKGGGVYPEVLFDVARQWYSLYQKVRNSLYTWFIKLFCWKWILFKLVCVLMTARATRC